MDTKNNNQRGELITALNKIAARQLTQTQAHQFDNFIARAVGIIHLLQRWLEVRPKKD
ncbi:hypothetical protein OAD77_02665 [Porticoccaceae bacterium]|nr:hypothetical protein [Porticoccaceae bacterium]MDB9969649.1 hypothetical protein [Porticoccaceae bacterium]